MTAWLRVTATSLKTVCLAVGMMSSFAPETRPAISRALAVGTNWSAPPCTTSIGALINSSRSHAS